MTSSIPQSDAAYPPAAAPVPSDISLLATPQQVRAIGPRLEEILVQVLDAEGQRICHGPGASLPLELVRPEDAGDCSDIRGRMRRETRRGLARFRNLECTASGTYRLGFQVAGGGNAGIPSTPRSNWVDLHVPEDTFASAAALPFPVEVGIIEMTPWPTGAVRLGAAVTPPIRVELRSILGARIHDGPASRGRVRIRTVPELRLSGNIVDAFQGVAEFSHLRVLAAPNRGEQSPRTSAPGARPRGSYRWEAIFDAEHARLTASCPPFRLST